MIISTSAKKESAAVGDLPVVDADVIRVSLSSLLLSTGAGYEMH